MAHKYNFQYWTKWSSLELKRFSIALVEANTVIVIRTTSSNGPLGIKDWVQGLVIEFAYCKIASRKNSGE
jgi:hypothetical protein